MRWTTEGWWHCTEEDWICDLEPGDIDPYWRNPEGGGWNVSSMSWSRVDNVSVPSRPAYWRNLRTSGSIWVNGVEAVAGAAVRSGVKPGGLQRKTEQDGHQPLHEPNRLSKGQEFESNTCSRSHGWIVPSSYGIQDRWTILSLPNIGLSIGRAHN